MTKADFVNAMIKNGRGICPLENTEIYTWNNPDPWERVERNWVDLWKKPLTTDDLKEIDKIKNSLYNIEKEKENKSTMFDSNNFFGKLFGKVAPGQVRMSMNGDMAIKTSNGYKTYNVEDGSLTNCDNFVFDVGSEFFFIIPTNKVEKGDVILASGKPHCVIKTEDNRIEALRYEDGSIVNIVPERNMFMGRTYFYGKIVSMFGQMKGKSKGMNSMMKYMVMSEMMKGNKGSDMGSMLPMMMLMNGGGFEDMFAGMFDFGEDEKEEK